MKVNLGVELNDAQRVALSCILAGKIVKRMASRDDVRAFLAGVVGGLDLPADDVVVLLGPQADETLAGVSVSRAAASEYTEAEQAIVERLTSEGRSPEYIRGFISAGRVLAQNGHKLRITS